jgi:uncharacterized protein YndB with AHSA1/START domain
MFHELNIVTKDIEINSPPSKVFAAWTEPDHLQRWFTDQVLGWPGVGSNLTFKWKNFGFSVDYKLAEMRPDTKLVFKTRLSGIGTQVLTVKLARRAPKTIVTLSESGPENHKSDPKESGVESGWEMALGLLKYYIETQFGKDRETFFAMLPAVFELEKLHHLFTTTEGLQQWLTVESAPPEKPGDLVKFRFDGGQTISGRVLAITHHELALSWDEIDGYLELKSFPTQGENKGLCLRGATYSPQTHSTENLEGIVKDALVKLFAAVSTA